MLSRCHTRTASFRLVKPVLLLVPMLAVGEVAVSVAQGPAFPPSFQIREIPANGTTIHVRVSGSGPAVVLLHGYGETGDMWVPLAAALARDHQVIVPDLRGMGLSAVAQSGFEKKNQALDVVGVMDAMGISQADVVAHDIGNMVAFAVCAWHPERVKRLVLMDAPVPGVGPWDEILKNPLLWHFRFGGPDMERLVAGRERIYLDRFWNDFSADPRRFNEAMRAHFAALYARPGNMHAGFLQFAAFDQDAIDNREFLAGHRLELPILAIGGDHSFGKTMAEVIRFAGDDVRGGVIANAGHWIMEEQPDSAIAMILPFLAGSKTSAHLGPEALNRSSVDALPRKGGGPGTSGVGGIETTVMYGDPGKPGPYAIAIRVPAHTRIAPHTHRDERFATVISGEWYFGYGTMEDATRATMLGPGGFYTEPGDSAHYAYTRGKPAIVYVTGYGPSDTRYLKN